MSYWHQPSLGNKVDEWMGRTNEKEISKNMLDHQEENQEHKEESAPTNNEHAEPEMTVEDSASAEMTEQSVSEIDALKSEVAELKDKYLRLFSEFENYKRRTSKEKIDFFKTANEDLMSALLPVLDDFERAQKSIQNSSDINTVIEGIQLVQNKLSRTLENKGLKHMDTPNGTPFDTELHEAITQFPAPSEELKGKIIDTAEKGYYLNEKVIRFAKVIIGN